MFTFGGVEEKQALHKKQFLQEAYNRGQIDPRALNEENRELLRQRVKENPNIATAVSTNPYGPAITGQGTADYRYLKAKTSQEVLDQQLNPGDTVASNILKGQAATVGGEFNREQYKFNQAGGVANQVNQADINSQKTSLEANFGKFVEDVKNVFDGEAIKGFNIAIYAFVDAMNKFPNPIQVEQNVKHEVILNGGEAFKSLLPAMQQFIAESITSPANKNFIQGVIDAQKAK